MGQDKKTPITIDGRVYVFEDFCSKDDIVMAAPVKSAAERNAEVEARAQEKV